MLWHVEHTWCRTSLSGQSSLSRPHLYRYSRLSEDQCIDTPSRQLQRHEIVFSDNAPSDALFPMSWNLLERFIESEHFNNDPSLSVAYLSRYADHVGIHYVLCSKLRQFSYEEIEVRDILVPSTQCGIDVVADPSPVLPAAAMSPAHQC